MAAGSHGSKSRAAPAVRSGRDVTLEQATGSSAAKASRTERMELVQGHHEQWQGPGSAEPHRPGREAGAEPAPVACAGELQVQHVRILASRGRYASGVAKRPRSREGYDPVRRERSEIGRCRRQHDHLVVAPGKSAGQRIGVVADPARHLRQRRADEADLHCPSRFEGLRMTLGPIHSPIRAASDAIIRRVPAVLSSL
jgi:hypothetical protein